MREVDSETIDKMVSKYQKTFKHMKIDNKELNALKEKVKESLDYDEVVDDLI